LIRSSGQGAYDQAIERAIRAAQPLPVPRKPELFPRFRELNLEFEHEK
jgi:colicin import membrane protein